MLGLSTETGRETAVTSSSYLGTQALTDPTLALSDSSRPQTPHQEGRGQPQDGGPSGVILAPPSGGGPAVQNSAASVSRPAPASHTAVRGQQHPAQNTGATLGSAPCRGDALGPRRPPAGAPTPLLDILQVLQHMQHLQMQQMKDMQQQNMQNMLILMQQLQPPGPRPRPVPRRGCASLGLCSTSLLRVSGSHATWAGG